MRISSPPDFKRIPKRLLVIDRSYQREITGQRSQALIGALAANWSWIACGVLIVAPVDGGRFNVVDGQHRLEAAKRLPHVQDLPCFISDAKDVREQARLFVSINQARVNVTPVQVFWAQVLAGDEEATGIVNAAKRAGVKIMRYVRIKTAMAPHETLALGALRKLYRGELGPQPGGAPMVTDILKLMREAYPDKPGQLGGHYIGAVARVLANQVKRPVMLETLRRTDSHQMSIEAAKLREKNEELRQTDALYKALWHLTVKVHNERAGQSMLRAAE